MKEECRIHKFEPRYDEVERQGKYKMRFMFQSDMRKFFTLKVYVHDICIRCGKIVKREK